MSTALLAAAGRYPHRRHALCARTSMAWPSNLRKVAAALGNPARAEPWLRRLAALRRDAPRRASWTRSGSPAAGSASRPNSLGAQWLRLAGLRQRPLPGGRATLETLLTNPPKVLIKSDYRSDEMSGGERWLAHPIVRHAGRAANRDGRTAWTCIGPLMIPEIERLRKAGAVTRATVLLAFALAGLRDGCTCSRRSAPLLALQRSAPGRRAAASDSKSACRGPCWLSAMVSCSA